MLDQKIAIDNQTNAEIIISDLLNWVTLLVSFRARPWYIVLARPQNGQRRLLGVWLWTFSTTLGICVANREILTYFCLKYR